MISFPRLGIKKNTFDVILQLVILFNSCDIVIETERNWLIHEALTVQTNHIFLIEREHEKLFVVRFMICKVGL